MHTAHSQVAALLVPLAAFLGLSSGLALPDSGALLLRKQNSSIVIIAADVKLTHDTSEGAGPAPIWGDLHRSHTSCQAVLARRSCADTLCCLPGCTCSHMRSVGQAWRQCDSASLTAATRCDMPPSSALTAMRRPLPPCP